MLHIDGVDDFNVQWHMAADMKTIKAMYGLKSGPGCKMHCIYCEQKCKKATTGTTTQVCASIRVRSKNTLEGGLFAASSTEMPCD